MFVDGTVDVGVLACLGKVRTLFRSTGQTQTQTWQPQHAARETELHRGFTDIPKKINARKDLICQHEIGRLMDEEGMERTPATQQAQKHFELLSTTQFDFSSVHVSSLCCWLLSRSS